MTDFTAWTAATGNMPWGADSYNGSPCLVNAINPMISKDSSASPSNFAGEVVLAFDAVNGSLFQEIGEPNADRHYVTPFVADILLQKFGLLKTKPADEPVVEPSVMDDPYVEKSDADLMDEWLTAATKPAEQECAPLPEVSDADMAEIESYLKG
jgi:hypothetical protein